MDGLGLASRLVSQRLDAAAFVTFKERFSAGTETRPISDAFMVAFEDVHPVRRPAAFKGQRNFAGLWWCATNQRHVGFESWCERDNLVWMDFDRGVSGISSQPFRITLPTLLPQRTHVPDFFLRRSDGTAVVVDVRPDARVKEADREVFDATSRMCATVGWEYRRLGGLPAVYASNLRWLAGYRHPRCRRGADSMAALGLLESEGPMSVHRLADSVGERTAVLPTLFHLLWTQQVFTELKTRPLSLDSLVWTERL